MKLLARGRLRIIYFETYTINAVEGDTSGKKLVVSALGEDVIYKGVETIVARGEDNDSDTLFVGNGVKSVVDFDLGAGKDSVVLLDAGSGSSVRMGAGDDKLLSRAGSSYVDVNGNYVPSGTYTFDLGDGNDLFTGSNTKDILYDSGGENVINTTEATMYHTCQFSRYCDTGEDSDTVTIDGENSDVTVNTGSENDLITINGGAHTVNAGSGDDQIIVNGGSNAIYGDDGDDSVEINLTEGRPLWVAVTAMM